MVVSPLLLQVLETVRLIYKKPMVVASGYRCSKHNQEVGGVQHSEHTTGEAADIAVYTGQDRFKLLSACFLAGVRRIGIGSNFIHIGVSETLPRDVAWMY